MPKQLFINNWSADLVASVTASDVELPIAPAAAARLTGLGAGDFYELTLVQKDDGGAEIAWEVVTATSAGDGLLTVERSSAPLSWVVGTQIEARLTASALALLQAPAPIEGALTRANLLGKLEGGYLGMSDALFWADSGLGAYARHDLGRCFSWVAGADFSTSDSLDLRDGYAHVLGEGTGVNLYRVLDVVSLGTGGTNTGWCSVSVNPAEPGIYAPLHGFSLLDDAIAEIDARLVMRLPNSPNATDDFTVECELNIPGIGPIRFRQARLVNSGNMTITYGASAGGNATINTSFKVSTFDLALCVSVKPAGSDFAVEISTRFDVASDIDKTVRASLLASAMSKTPVQLGYTATITKTAGTSNRGLQVKRFSAQLTLS